MGFIVGTKESVGVQHHHHGNIKALWEDHWKFRCKVGAYPFNQGTVFDDFPAIFDELIEKGINDPSEEAYPAVFKPYIRKLIDEADEVFKTDPKAASPIYLRACSVCHVSRYPVLNTEQRREIWEWQKRAYLRASSVWPDPVQSVDLPFKHAGPKDGSVIPIAVRYAHSTKKTGKMPVIILISGLDGYKYDCPGKHTEYFNAQGWTIVMTEIPGCGDCPCDRKDPTSPERQWDTVLDWIKNNPELDETNVIAFGYSTGAYYSARIAHTHASRLKGCVAQGNFAHYAFTNEWLGIMDVGEYFASLSKSLCCKFGYETLDEMCEHGMKTFSLLENGILDMPSCRMLISNGIDDTIYPIEDSLLLAQRGRMKEIRLITGGMHMGEPQSGPYCLEWCNRIIAAAPEGPSAM